MSDGQCPGCGYDIAEQIAWIDSEAVAKDLRQKIEIENRDIFEVVGELFREHGLIWREQEHKRQLVQRNINIIWREHHENQG